MKNIFSFMRKLAILPIRLYQLCISPMLPPSCRYIPTCSAYAIEAIATHGIVKGGYYTMRRLMRCHPLGSCGYDPVPPKKVHTGVIPEK